MAKPIQIIAQRTWPANADGSLAMPDGAFDVTTLMDDGTVWHRYFGGNPPTWTDWGSIGAPGAPAAPAQP